MLAALIALAAMFSAPAAALAADGAISGTVTDASSGEPLEGAEVCATEAGGGLPACVVSAADGTYAIVGLSAGSFRVEFTPGSGEIEAGISGPGNYLTQYWKGKTSIAQADLVAVATGATAAGVDAAMEPGGIVSGTVTDATSDEPVEDVEVCVHRSGGVGFLSRCAATGFDGRYAIAGLPGGGYKVSFGPSSSDLDHASQWYSGQQTGAAADSVTVSQGSATTGIDAELAQAGRISGSVSAAGGGTLAGLSVCAIPVDPETGTSRCDPTGSGGNYTIGGLTEGEYVVQFHGGFDYLDEYYAGRESYAESDRVAVAAGSTTTGIDADLESAARIEGHVSDALTEAAVVDVEVCVVLPGEDFYFNGHCARSGIGGDYAISGLRAGSYLVRFKPTKTEVSPGHLGTPYLSQFYDEEDREGEAETVAVSAGGTSGSIDAAMRRGGEVSGTVTAAGDGAPLAGIEVCVGAPGDYLNGTCTETAADGTYTLTGLDDGRYRVAFSTAYDDERNFIRQYSDGRLTEGEADLVTVTAGEETAGIDAEMQAGGTIAGRVTDATSQAPVAGIRVCTTNYNARCAVTDAGGEYELRGLPNGSYKLRFSPDFSGPMGEYLPQLYAGKKTNAEADLVAVAAGSATAGVDVAMVAAGKITGTVSAAASGEPLKQVVVCAEATGSGGSCVQTDADGHYTLGGLDGGSYTVSFRPEAGTSIGGEGPPGRNYLLQYYDGAGTDAAATPVAVAAGAVASGVDAALEGGGRISGRITLADSGAPYAGAEACALVDGERQYDHCAFANSNGEYAIEGLATGGYVVGFFPAQAVTVPPNYVAEYFDGKLSPAAADPVTVTVGTTHEHVDAALATGGQITGHVVGAADSKSIQGVQVCALEAGSGEEPLACGSTNAFGDYTISGLATGSYLVEFSHLRYEPWNEEEFPFEQEGEGEGAATPVELQVRQFWQGSATAGGAELVEVSTGAVTDEIGASMVAGSSTDPWPALGIGFAGSGAGTVASAPAGISCSASCAHGFAPGTEVTLVPHPADGSAFSGWSGACVGTRSCQVTLASTASVVATFAAAAGGEGEGGGGGGGGAAPVTGSDPSPPFESPQPRPRSKRLKCKKGFQKKKVKRKLRCVRKKHHRRRHHHKRRQHHKQRR